MLRTGPDAMTLVRNPPLNNLISHNDTQLSYAVNYRYLSHFDASLLDHGPTLHALPHKELPTFGHSLYSKAQEFYSQSVEPKLTKEYVDNFIVGTIGYSTYYGLMPGVSQLDSGAFIKRGGISIGFKLFNTLVTPAISQFVESFTEMHINNAKYSYHSAKCLLDSKHCDETKKFTNPFSFDESKKAPLFHDFSQFDTTSYLNKVNEGLSKLSLPGLFTTGMISATASEIKDFTYAITGFDNYCSKSNFCKNWVSYYYKEWLKNDIKSLISGAQEKHQAESVKPIESEAPQDKGSQIHINDVIQFESPSSGVIDVNTNSTPVTMDVLPLSMNSILNQIYTPSTAEVIM